MTPTKRRMAREIAELRYELARMQAQLEALQADRIKVDWANLFGQAGDRLPRVSVSPLEPFRIAPTMGVRMFADASDFEDESPWIDDDDENA